MPKLNDYFLNLMFNPTFTPGDFQTVGLTSDNTSIEDINTYKKLDEVRNNELFLTNGTFDENKLKKFYDETLQQFNLFSLKGAGERLAGSYSAFRDDIFAKSNNKVEGPETFISKMPNPNAQSIGFVSKNVIEKPRKSGRELAEAHLLWDGATNSWKEAPNDTPLDNFLHPKVLAQWDTDVDINGKKRGDVGFDAKNIKYHKGDKKVNPITGEYYYESLNGRTIYGREVLSGWDTLTTDGSKYNKYDFFDSDDLEKSAGGSLMKAVVKIAPALIPAVSPWYLFARVTLAATDLFAKVGKLLPGVSSNNQTLSWLEGINKAATMSTSDYGQQHPWKLENMLNLAADVFTLLGEQRWIFKYGSALVNGKLSTSIKAQKKFLDATEAEYKAKFMKEIGSIEDAAIRLPALAASEAQSALQLKMAAGQKFSEHLSKLYMTGITVSDSFGEAKQAGLSDLEAALFTLVYAAGEYGILSTNLGEHILPELRAEKNRWKNIVYTLHDIKERTGGEGTKRWYREVTDFFKLIVKGDLNDSKIASALKKNSTAKALALSVGSNAIGEGLEEVSEEVWFDLAKTFYNAAAKMHLTATGATMNIEGDNLEDIFNRYALNFVGGLMGGAIAVGLPGFQLGVKNMLGTNMDRKQAYLELVAIIRNNKKDEFLKTASKLVLNDPNLSARKFETKDGAYNYEQGTKEDNLDLAAHKVLTDMVNSIEKALNVNGANLDDETILKHLTTDARKLLLFHRVMGGDTEGSAVLASYVLDYNTLAVQIGNLAIEIDALKHPGNDLLERLAKASEDNARIIQEKSQKLLKLLQLRDMYLNGEMTKYALPAAIFEMSDYISAPYLATNFKEYVKSVEHKVLSELTDARVAELKEEWDGIRENYLLDDIRTAHSYFQMILKKFSDHLENFKGIIKLSENELYNLGSIFQQAEVGNKGILNIGTTEDILRNTQNYERDANLTEEPNINKTAIALASLLREMIAFNPDKDYSRIDLKLALALINPENIENPEVVLEVLNELYPGKSVEMTAENIRKAQKDALNEATVELLYKHLGEILEVLKDLPYLSNNIKEFLKSDIIGLTETGGLQEAVEFLMLEDIISEDDVPEETEAAFWSNYYKAIDAVPTTPIELLIDAFLLALGDGSMKVSELIHTLAAEMKKSANTGNIQDFGYSDEIANQLKNALKIIELLGAHVLAAREDGANEGNLFGYNVVMNVLFPDAKLATIDKNTANIIMNDLAKLRDKLLYYLGIFDVNAGAKLLELDKIKNRILVAFLNRLKTLLLPTSTSVQVLPEEWNVQSGETMVLDNLKSVLSKAHTFAEISSSTNSDKYSLSSEKAMALEKEYVKVLDAIYELFEANADKIADGKLSQILDLFKLLPSTKEKSNTYDGTMVDPLLEALDDRSFLWILTAAAGVKTSEFYAEYIFDDRYAPIPGLELAIRMAYSFLLNKPLFNAFAKAYNDKLLKELQTENVAQIRELYGKAVTKDSKLENHYAVNYFNTFLVEGIPGAGKSTGFYSVLIKMLNTYHKEFLNEVWVIHTDAEKASKLAQSIGLETSKCKFFSKNSYLQKICPTYTEPTTKNGVILVDFDNLKEDAETGVLHYANEEIATDCGTPSLIIIDESTRFSSLDLLLSEKFQNQILASALATGDYDLIGAIGQGRLDESTIITISTAQDNFIHSPKLGTSMRTDNKLKDINIYMVRKRKLEITNLLRDGTTPPVRINLQYYQNSDPSSPNYGIHGDKIVEAKEADDSIALMLNSVKPGEKLYFIYLSKDTDLYKKFKKLKEQEAYKDKIELVDSGSVQGEEGQYYVVELDTLNLLKERDSSEGVEGNVGNHKLFMDTFYTAISRSTLGTLIINNSNIQSIATSSQVQEFTNSFLGALAIKQYSEKRKKEINSFLTGEEKRTTIRGKVPKKTTGEEEPPPGEDEGGSTIDPNEGTVNRLNNLRTPVISNTSGDKTYNMLTHSMPVLETGFLTEDDGTLVPSTGYDKRIDGLNGLTKLPKIKVGDKPILANPRSANSTLGVKNNKLINQETAVETLNKLRAIGSYETDMEEIKRQVKEVLGLNVDFGVNFLYMTVSRMTEDKLPLKKKFGRFFRDVQEKIIGLFVGSTSESKEATLGAYFAMNIYVVDGDNRKSVLTIPISIFTSPLTMMETLGMQPLKRLFPPKSVGDLGVRMLRMKELLSDKTAFETAISSFSEEDKKLARLNRGKLLSHFNIYTYYGSDTVVLFPDDWTFAGQASKLTGPNITTHEKGSEYYEKRFYWPGEFIDLDDLDTSVHSVSRDVFFATLGDIKANGEILVKKGYPFVLISDYYDLSELSKEEVLDLFVKNELTSNPAGKITPIAICTPAVGFEEYFENLAAVITGDKIHADANVGNKLTDFRIALSITKKGSAFSNIIQLEIDKENASTRGSLESRDNKEIFKYRLNTWKAFVNLIKALQTDFEGKTPELILTTLEKKGIEDKYWEVLLQGNPELSVTWKGLSLKKFISLQVVDFVLRTNPKNAGGDLNYDKSTGKLSISPEVTSRIEAVKTDSKDLLPYGIITNVKGMGSENNVTVSNGRDSHTFASVALVEGKYQVHIKGKDRSLRINGKIDTTMHVIDGYNIIKLIEGIMYPKSPEDLLKLKNMLGWYNNDSWPNPKPEESKQKAPKKIRDLFTNKEDLDAFYSIHWDEIKDITSIIELSKILNEKGYIIFTNNSKITLIEKEGCRNVIGNIIQKENGLYGLITPSLEIIALTRELLELEMNNNGFSKDNLEEGLLLMLKEGVEEGEIVPLERINAEAIADELLSEEGQRVFLTEGYTKEELIETINAFKESKDINHLFFFQTTEVDWKKFPNLKELYPYYSNC